MCCIFYNSPFLEEILIQAFPKPLQKRYKSYMQSHKLKREIIATKLSNIVVNEMGFTFTYRGDNSRASRDRSILPSRGITTVQGIPRMLAAKASAAA